MTRIIQSATRCREPAQVVVLFALGVLGFVGLLGLVLDGGNLYVQRRTGQTAADAAALAGTRALMQAPATAGGQAITSVSQAVCDYAQLNAFGVRPEVSRAYFVRSDGATQTGTNIVSSPLSCPAPGSVPASYPAGTIPTDAAGVHVDVRIPFSTYLVGIIGVPNLAAEGHATGQVGVLTHADARNAPLIICGGGSGNVLRLTTITPGVVRTSTPGVLAATPTAMPRWNNPGVQPDEVVADRLLVTPAAGPPTLVPDGMKDGAVYYIKGQRIGEQGSDCGASGFKGAANDTQPTPSTMGPGDTMWGSPGNDVPGVASQIATTGACLGGTDLDSFSSGQPGCVMILPLTSDGSSAGGNKPMTVSSWGAFYVWCIRNSGSTCQEVGGQFLANWSIASGQAASTWTFGAQGGITVIRLTA
jgi:hypothetical protein